MKDVILGELDGYDQKILQILAIDGRITVTGSFQTHWFKQKPMPSAPYPLAKTGIYRGSVLFWMPTNWG